MFGLLVENDENIDLLNNCYFALMTLSLSELFPFAVLYNGVMGMSPYLRTSHCHYILAYSLLRG